jgi:plastocyanin
VRRAGLAAAIAVGVLAAVPAGAAGGPTVFVVDNAFVRDVQRPVLRVPSGTTVTWAWRSQQSHGVSGAGPQRFASSIRSRGAFRHRFTRAGTYRILCPLHAPGMKMTVVVRR